MSDMQIKLTNFQLEEVGHGMEIDHDDGNPEWGRLDGNVLHITNIERAIYRVTSSRDIWLDNAADGMPGYRGGATSLSKLTDKLVALAGGLDALPPEIRRWV